MDDIPLAPLEECRWIPAAMLRFLPGMRVAMSKRSRPKGAMMAKVDCICATTGPRLGNVCRASVADPAHGHVRVRDGDAGGEPVRPSIGAEYLPEIGPAGEQIADVHELARPGSTICSFTRHPDPRGRGGA